MTSDRDGFSNFAEYALGLDPSVPDAEVTTLDADGAWLYFTYTRPSAVTDAVYQVEWSFTLNAGTWSSGGVTQQILSDDGTSRTVRAVIPAGAGGRRFVRLKMTR